MCATRAKTKGGEGMVEFFLVLTMPIWLPIRAIQIMVREIRKERRKKTEEEQ